jgi:hypothetical protein
MASDGHAWPWASDPGPGGCAQLDPLPLADGIVPTLVVVRASGNCKDAVRKNTGVVFFGTEPVAWNCLSDDELSAFKAWGTAAFSSVHILTVTSPAPAINCPPPKLTASELAAVRDAIRDDLRRLAPLWFAQPALARAS